MRTTVDLPDELFRQAKASAALQGRSFKDLVADGLKLLLQSHGILSQSPPRPADSVTAGVVAEAEGQMLTGASAASLIPARHRGSAGAWARRFVGVARLAPEETTDDARADHYRKKYGI